MGKLLLCLRATLILDLGKSRLNHISVTSNKLQQAILFKKIRVQLREKKQPLWMRHCVEKDYLSNNLAWIAITTSGKHQETLNIWITPFSLWSMLGTSSFGYWFHWQGMGGRWEKEFKPRREPAAERKQRQTGRARAGVAPSQGDAGMASSLSVLVWPSQSLNLNPWTNCRVSWWSQLTINPLQF